MALKDDAGMVYRSFERRHGMKKKGENAGTRGHRSPQFWGAAGRISAQALALVAR